MTKTAKTKIAPHAATRQQAAPLLRAAPASVRRELVRSFRGSARSAEAFLAAMTARQREYLIVRARCVSAYFAWFKRKPSPKARYRVGDRRRGRTGCVTDFLTRWNGSTGMRVTERTLSRWSAWARKGGLGRLVDYRGKRGDRRRPMDLRALTRLCELVDAGTSVRAADVIVRSWAAKRGFPWPSRRTVHLRMRERQMRLAADRNSYLTRGASMN